jgi:DNA/RNA-binding domain of Phe-tRNA-synthetase-like protein
LKFGRFRATGRNKPAQEYLMRCAVEQGALPEINAPVDLLNAVSLECNVPISLLSLERCSPQLLIDRGRQGESFVFNAAGQVLDVSDMLVICDASQHPRRPVGSPVKDSLVGKITSEERHLVAVIYSAEHGTSRGRGERARDLLVEGVKRFEIAESIGMLV